MRRRPSQELLDTDAGSPREVSDSLLDLRWFNRWFGGIATVSEMVGTVARSRNATRLTLLEVASGEGFVPKTVERRARTNGIELNVTLLDRITAHLPSNGLMPKIAADAMALPFRAGAFDLVSSSLFVHHLSPEEAVLHLRDALRVCRAAVLVHDLVRHPLHLAFALAGSPLYRSRLTRNDAPASVRQAYTPAEMQGFCRQAGAVNVEVHRHFFFRMGVIAWKQA